LLHYPPQNSGETGFGIHPHKDTDALTILAEDPVGGLMVKCRDSDEWIDAVPRFDTVVEPLITPQAGFSRSSVHVGDVSKEVWRTNWPDVVSDKPHFDLGTLED
jgi:isopenicillin N synthase-like dioxygenase